MGIKQNNVEHGGIALINFVLKLWSIKCSFCMSEKGLIKYKGKYLCEMCKNQLLFWAVYNER